MSLFKNVNEKQILRWYLDAGVDETITNVSINRLHPVRHKKLETMSNENLKKQAEEIPDSVSSYLSNSNYDDISKPMVKETSTSTLPQAPIYNSSESSTHEELLVGMNLAQNAKTIEDLHQALKNFEGCPLKKTATNLVFAEGNAKAQIMLIGEGPGSEEDRQGQLFVGASGKLLDKMLSSIGLSRENVFVSNTVFWRPPGNRTPTSHETSICLPFVERMIELVAPQILVTLGGAAANLLLAQGTSVGRLRGKWFSYSTQGLSNPIDATAIFHPAYLLRSPAQKRDTWKDWKVIKHKLDGM